MEAHDGSEIPYCFESSVIHAGTAANFGHYYCVKQDTDKITLFNDAMVSQFAFQPTSANDCYLNALQHKFKSDTPYILCFRRIHPEEQQPSATQKPFLDLTGAPDLAISNVKAVHEGDAKLFAKEI